MFPWSLYCPKAELTGHNQRRSEGTNVAPRLLLHVEDAHDVTKALGVFRDLEF